MNKLKNKKSKELLKKQNKKNILEKGARNIKDFIAPASISRKFEDCLIVNEKYLRSFIINGFPNSLSVGWLDKLYNYDGDLDTVIYVEPTNAREAIDELTLQITQLEAQLEKESNEGSIKNTSKYGNMIRKLYSQRERLEENHESLFYVQVLSQLCTNSQESLNKQYQMLNTQLNANSINLMPLYLRQDEGFKSVLPFGKNYIDDKYRNFNSGALTSCFPFYNSEIMHPNGIFCGVNLYTGTPEYIDFYDRNLLINGNVAIFGESGSGKTYFISLLNMRSVLHGIRTVIIDAEGNYTDIAKKLGGGHIYIAPDSTSMINVFDLEEEVQKDGSIVVKINDKVSDILNLIAVMNKGLSSDQKSEVSYIIQDLYFERGFTEDPKSLYEPESKFDEKTGEFVQNVKKQMPIFSDFHNKLVEVAKRDNNAELMKLANALRMFKKGGIYGMFDCQTSDDLKDFSKAPIITFDISQLEENILRPIGMYIALSWTWEKFIKKNPHQKKRVVCDEAWILVDENMEGYEYTAAFLEKAARRIRKRNGGLVIASQDYIEFDKTSQGKAIITNACVKFFFKQSTVNIDALQRTFNLSDGERNFLIGAKKGHMLTKMNSESSVSFAFSFDYEHDLIENAS